MEQHDDSPCPEHAGGRTGPRNKAFPVSWLTTGRRLLLVGGCLGDLCRLRHALQFDWSRITVAHSGQGSPLCSECIGDERVCVLDRELTDQDVLGADLVIEGTDDEKLGARVAVWCRAHGVPLNAMDKPDLCDFHYPSLLIRGPLVLSVLSGGDAPALSAALRRHLDHQLGPGWATAAELFSETRRRLPGGQARSDLLRKLAHDPRLLDLIEQNDEVAMRDWIEDAVSRLRTSDR